MVITNYWVCQETQVFGIGSV